MLTISDAAINLIVSEEDSDEAYYLKHYQHWEWPGGASGPTCGIGYDCGYATVEEIRDDWRDIVDRQTVENIVRGCGLRGELAAAFVRQHKYAITITWPQGIQEFKQCEVPKWLGRLIHSLPNCDKLSPDSLGALLSLVYNRGASFDLPGPRYSEMRSIKVHMASQNFVRIPDDIRAMKRLWPTVSGLRNRRDKEADLFERGLK